MQIKRGLMKSAKKLRLGAKRTGAYVYGTLRRIVGNGVRTHNKEGQKLYVVLVRGVPLKYQPPFKPGIVYYTKGWAIKKARAFGGEVVSVSDFMKYQRDTRKRAIQLGYMPKEYLSESERKLVANPGVRERVMQIIRQDGEDKTDGEVLDEIYDYLKSVPVKDSFVRNLIRVSGQKVGLDKGEGEILDEVFRTIQKNGRGLRGNPMRSFASLHPSDRAKLKSFFDYVYSYYGKGGLYARDFKNGGFDRKTIERAIMVYIDDVRKGKTEWGGGDSIDRERVRTILQPSYSMFIPKEGTVTIKNNSRRYGNRLMANPRLGKYEQKALNFARKYPGWHGFDPRKPTANIVRRLEKKGLVKVSDISNQFRAI